MGVSGQHHAPAALYPQGKDPGTHCTGGWVGPRAGLDTEDKICFGNPLLSNIFHIVSLFTIIIGDKKVRDQRLYVVFPQLCF
jgi:hypothetical protein